MRVQVEDIFKSFRTGLTKKDVLNGITLNIDDGEVVSLVGPNGAGKSTLLKITAGILKLSTGKITINGKIGYMPEMPAFSPELTAKEHLEYVTSITSGVYRDDLLSTVGLNDINYPASRFSKGMQKRLNLAMALSVSPQVLIMDEPFEGMDPPMVIHMWEILSKFSKDGGSVLVSSHDLHTVNKISTRILYLKNGKVVDTSGSSERIMEISVLENAETLLIFLKENGYSVAPIGGNSVQINVEKEQISSVVYLLSSNGYKISGITDITAESVYTRWSNAN